MGSNVVMLVPHGEAENATLNKLRATRAVTRSCVNICRTDRRCLDQIPNTVTLYKDALSKGLR